MAKDKQQKSAPTKKGTVINRRNNRTVNQDVKASESKWVHVMNVETNPPSYTGVIMMRGSNTFIKRDRKTGQWQSVSPHSV